MTINHTNEEQSQMDVKIKAEKNAIIEISRALERADNEKQFINDVVNRLKEEQQSDPAELRRLGKLHFKQNIEEEREKANSVFDRYEKMFPESVGE